MTHFINLIEFLGAFLLFTFPLFQGLLDMREQIDSLAIDEATSQPKISPWLWIWPPLKIRKERERALAILSANVTAPEQISSILSFLDKATAWLYIGFGGWLLMFASTYHLLTELTERHLALLLPVAILLLTFLGTLNAVYRVNQKKRQSKLKKIEQSLAKERMEK